MVVPMLGSKTKSPRSRYWFQEWVYTQLGYTLDGYVAKLPPKLNPFLLGKPPWAK